MKKIKAIMFLGLVVALLVIGFSAISEAAGIEGKREKATIQMKKFLISYGMKATKSPME